MQFRRFLPWFNNLEKKTETVTDTKTEIKKIEYKVMERMEKTLEVRVLQSKVPVTKGYTQRKLKPTTENFGVGGGEEVRNNVGLTIIQRDNIWHPFYEVKLEEDDMGAKYRKNMESKKQAAAVEGSAIEEIKQKIDDLEQAERAEKDAKEQPAEKKKKTFDLNSIMAKKKAEEEIESMKKVDDPYAVKLTNVPAATTEAEIRAAMKKFGQIEQCFIPPTEDRSRRSKIAIVRFKFKEEATRAVEEKDVNIEFGVVTIERALAK